MRLLRRFWKEIGTKSYAQCGEDLITAYLLFNVLGITCPTYLDIGAHHPYELSNTYFFYRLRCAGVCVEANPILSARIQAVRQRDVCLNVGVSGKASAPAEFYVISPSTLSTFSKPECDLYLKNGYSLKEVIRIPRLSINEVIQEQFQTAPNFVSIDTEGLDLEILRAFNFHKFRPEVFCVETVSHTTEEKIASIDTLMTSAGYLCYADTFINSIYVDKGRFEQRRRGSQGAAK